MKIKEFLKDYTCTAGTEIHIYLPREAHKMTIVEALESYGESEIAAWRLSESKAKVITVEIDS